MSGTSRDGRAAPPADSSNQRIDLASLAVGLGAFILGTALGRDAGLLDAIVAPPAFVRACLVGAAILVGLGIFAAGIARIDDGRQAGDEGPADLIRGVRLVFLGLAALAAAAGWLVANPLPIVVALVIAAVDVVETSFILILTRRRRPGEG